MLYPKYDPANLPEDQRHANLETVRRVRAAVSSFVDSERQRRQAEGLIHYWESDREDLDRTARALSIPPISDEEWKAIQDREPQ